MTAEAIAARADDATEAAKRLDAALAEAGKAWAVLKDAADKASECAPEERVPQAVLQVLAGKLLTLSCDIQPQMLEDGDTRLRVLDQFGGHFARLPIAAEEVARKAQGYAHG